MESLDEVALPARSAQGSAAVQNTAPQSPIPSAQPLTQSSAQVLYPSEMFNQPSILLDVNKIYRIQVGAYKQPQNAMDVFDKLKMAGLNPDYEPYGDYCRVVLKRIKQEDLKMVTERVESAGFRDIIVREE
ncbi:MAG: SPOR domain-containing protein, partial [Treponema sp.]|jgi:cell division protein FtsN|nr:SPOR domain-containing protein [Treponema sp.]